MTSALVLSGGSIKGAYQAGAISAVLKQGFTPSLIYGISVGSINGAFLADRAGRHVRAGTPVNWPGIGAELTNFWTQRIRSLADLGKKRAGLGLLFSAVFSDFDGLVDMEPFDDLVGHEILPENLIAADQKGIKCFAGTMNLRDGTYFDAPGTHPRIIDYIIGSTAMPIIMPLKTIGAGKDKGYWLDGGTRNVTPLKAAIDAGATDITCIVCQQQGLRPSDFDRKSLLELADRISDVITQTILDNDLATFDWVNQFVPADGTPVANGPFKGYRYITKRVIRPKDPLGIDFETFTRADIARMIKQGAADAQQVLTNPIGTAKATPPQRGRTSSTPRARATPRKRGKP